MDLRTSRCVYFCTHTGLGECVDPGGMNFNKQQKEESMLKQERDMCKELICQQFELHINSTKSTDTGSAGAQ